MKSRLSLLRPAAAVAVAILLTHPCPAAPEATAVESMRIKEGFRVERLYSVPKDKEGSWVAMTIDTKGRLICSDQYGGLYRLTPGATAEDTKVENIAVKIGQAQGLVYAFDSLYLVQANDAYEGRGLYRVRDTDGDDAFDKVELLRKFANEGGEHGPHAVVRGPDGKSLYVVVGDQTAVTEVDRSRVPRVWGEDLLLPRIYGRGFMKGVMAPGGWIARTDPDGKDWELVSTGFRNQYDIGFNREGEMFTYDADMEWDMNTPWYRPTRVCHVTSGSEFGWRNGSGKWPEYYGDSLPPVVNIGPGSPTGVAFGYGAKFPAKYQDAFYICDWSYGKLYAVHLKPSGASYAAEFEEFISAQPLPLTDIEVNPKDGALYFTVGGRRVQSGVYRVTYNGPEPVAVPDATPPSELAVRRRALEAYHLGPDERAVEAAWPSLGHDDRFLRFAARVALEHNPVATWQDRALAETNPRALLTALMALARVGEARLKPAIVNTLAAIPWDTLDAQGRLDLVRDYSLVFTRMGGAGESERTKVFAHLFGHYPSGDSRLDIELSQMFAYLDIPEATPRTMALLDAAPTQQEQIAYAKNLRLVKSGWTRELRERYFQWFLKAANYRGGASFGLFVADIKKGAVESLSADELASLKPIIEAQPEAKASPYTFGAREFVKAYSVKDFEDVIAAGLEGGRNFENGRNLFGVGTCYVCHRFDGNGGAIGPDLTGVGGRFSPRDLLESIIEPSKEISDQYGSVILSRKDGSQVVGRIVNLNGDTVMVNDNMLDPDSMVNVNQTEVESIKPSPVSMMPPGLLNMMSKDDVLDLLAYLISGGNKESDLFK